MGEAPDAEEERPRTGGEALVPGAPLASPLEFRARSIPSHDRSASRSLSCSVYTASEADGRRPNDGRLAVPVLYVGCTSGGDRTEPKVDPIFSLLGFQ